MSPRCASPCLLRRAMQGHLVPTTASNVLAVSPSCAYALCGGVSWCTLCLACLYSIVVPLSLILRDCRLPYLSMLTPLIPSLVAAATKILRCRDFWVVNLQFAVFVAIGHAFDAVEGSLLEHHGSSSRHDVGGLLDCVAPLCEAIGLQLAHGQQCQPQWGPHLAFL
eukprot:282093-Amphidinium_carterae.1